MEIELSFEVEIRVSSYSSDLFQIFDRSHQILMFMWIFWILTRFIAHEVIFFNAAQVSFVALRTFLLSKIYDEFIASSVELAKKQIVSDLFDAITQQGSPGFWDFNNRMVSNRSMRADSKRFLTISNPVNKPEQNWNMMVNYFVRCIAGKRKLIMHLSIILIKTFYSE